jgi:excisionase family DNA binding protein
MVYRLFESERIYTVSEVAAVIRVSPVTVVRMIHNGELKALRVRGQWRILGSDILRYLLDRPGDENEP